MKVEVREQGPDQLTIMCGSWFIDKHVCIDKDEAKVLAYAILEFLKTHPLSERN